MMFSIDELKFDEQGLIPAVVVDSITKKVLTVAYMNRESLEISMKKGLTCFFSRSRHELWLKGETSGNYQHIVSITADCDNDVQLYPRPRSFSLPYIQAISSQNAPIISYCFSPTVVNIC